jgi:hypothetical protein
VLIYCVCFFFPLRNVKKSDSPISAFSVREPSRSLGMATRLSAQWDAELPSALTSRVPVADIFFHQALQLVGLFGLGKPQARCDAGFNH